MPKYYRFTCDQCLATVNRYANTRRCQCGGNLTRITNPQVKEDQINHLLSIIVSLIDQRCAHKGTLIPITPAECTAMQALEKARIVELVEQGRWQFRASYVAAGD